MINVCLNMGEKGLVTKHTARFVEELKGTKGVEAILLREAEDDLVPE